MAFDSLIRLRQLNNAEVSGYVVEILKKYFVTGTGINVSNTGSLSGSFYPLGSNPSGYVTGSVVYTSQTGLFVDTSVLAVAQANILNQVSGLYYPLTNPSGYITRTTGDRVYLQFGPASNTGRVILEDNVNAGNAFDFNPNTWFYIRGTGNATIALYNSSVANIIGINIYSTDIRLNGKTVLSDTGVFLNTGKSASNKNLYLRDTTSATVPFKYSEGSEFSLSGNGALIDVYGTNNPTADSIVSGFDIYANNIYLNGIALSTGGGGSLTQILQASGTLACAKESDHTNADQQ